MEFSIIVPVYNVEMYLKECIDSIVSQEFEDFELILVNDGSTDYSGDICEQYGKTYKNIIVVNKENGGQSSARNVGFKNSSGKYIVYLDSDDFICDKKFLMKLHNLIADEPDIIIYKYKKYYNANKILPCNYEYNFEDANNYYDKIKKLVCNDSFFCSAWSKCVKKDLLLKNNILFNENLKCEDMDWYYNVVTSAKTITFLNDVIVMYRQRENSITKNITDKTINDYIFTLNKWNKEFLKITNTEIQEIMLSSLAKLYFNLLVSICNLKIDIVKYNEIKRLSHLLNYDYNNRIKKFCIFYKIFGFKATLLSLKIIKFIRRIL